MNSISDNITIWEAVTPCTSYTHESNHLQNVICPSFVRIKLLIKGGKHRKRKVLECCWYITHMETLNHMNNLIHLSCFPKVELAKAFVGPNIYLFSIYGRQNHKQENHFETLKNPVFYYTTTALHSYSRATNDSQ